VADSLLDECRRCGGVWVESKVFESLVKNRDQQARLEAAAGPEITLEDRRPAPSHGAPPSRSPREYIPCPDCRQLMNRKNFGNISGVLVDICKSHGIWFDTGELGRIVKFVMRGGLVEARHRQLAELEREEKEKRVQQFVLSGMHDAGDAEPRSSWVAQLLQMLFRLLQ
jgi:Zn-finger nucleic acid-binding protein